MHQLLETTFLQVVSTISARGCRVVREIQGVQALVVSCDQQSNTGAVAAAAAAAATAVLADLPDVRMVVPNTVLKTPTEPELSQYYTSQSCTGTPPATDIDLQLGRDSEGTPYGVRMVQGDDAEVIEVSRLYKHRVMWCVVDTGLDGKNQEIPTGEDMKP
jgi:hypothetical protein